MEALEDHHRIWPELEAKPPRVRRSRQASSRPLLSLGVGLLSVPLLPPLALEAAKPSPTAGNCIGVPQPSGTAATEAQQLEAAVCQADPALANRLAATGERADAAFFERWLKARGSVEAAAAAIQAHAAWRTAFAGQKDTGAEAVVGPAAASGTAAAWAPEAAPASAGGLPPLGRFISESSIADELAARKVHLQGLDASGCPVVVVQACRHDMGRRDLAHTKRLIAYVLDSACATSDLERNPFGRICCLFDLAGLRPRNLDVKALLAIFELLQDHYPERLDSLYFLSAPWLFWGVWHVVSPFVHPATRRKIHFVSGAEGRRQLLARMSPQVLPARYGGAAELFPIDGAMTAWRRQQAAVAAAEAASTASSASSGGSGGSARRSRAASALRRGASATRSFVHHKVVRPVGGAAAGAARALRGHHAHLLAHRQGMGHSLPPEQQRSLLAQVVLTHVLLVGLLLRMLQRVLLLRGPALSTGTAAGKQDNTLASKPEPAAEAISPAADSEAGAAPAPVRPAQP